MKIQPGEIDYTPYEMQFLDERLPPNFWAKVIPESNSGCWLWLGTARGGYGRFGCVPRRKVAHRLAYEVAHGVEIPLGAEACHRCDTPSCVNPAHIFVGTHKDNMRDMSSKESDGRRRRRKGDNHGVGTIVARAVMLARTHCKRGHPFEGTNLGRTIQGHRICIACRVDYEKARSPRPWGSKRKRVKTQV